MVTNWWKLSSDLAMANLEAQRVIALRLAKLAKGDVAAKLEARRMIVEKIAASAEASMAIAAGRTPQSVLRRHRAIMRANGKRLAKVR